jgi:hypothetical protein
MPLLTPPWVHFMKSQQPTDKATYTLFKFFEGWGVSRLELTEFDSCGPIESLKIPSLLIVIDGLQGTHLLGVAEQTRVNQ